MNKLKYLLWNHGLIFAIIFFNILPVITASAYKSDLIPYNKPITGALLFQCLSLFFIVWGYKSYKKDFVVLKGNLNINVSKQYFLFMAALSLFGAFISYASLAAVTNVADLQSMVLSGDDVSDIRTEAGGGGLSGVFKMFACMPLFVFLATSSLLLFDKYDIKSKKYLLRTLILSFFCVLFKVFFYFDRLSILAILLVLTYNFFFNNSIPKMLKIAAISGLIFIVSILTLLRMHDIGLLGFLAAYFNLGVINLQVLIEKQVNFNYDFSQTFLGPLYFICKKCSISYHSYGPVDYVWNPAQSFWGFWYIDFKYIGFPVLYLLGRYIKKIEIYSKFKVSYQMLYFVFMYCAFSFTTIPIIRSMEFWLMIIVAIVVSHSKQLIKAG